MTDPLATLARVRAARKAGLPSVSLWTAEAEALCELAAEGLEARRRAKRRGERIDAPCACGAAATELCGASETPCCGAPRCRTMVAAEELEAARGESR
jgi:hypothetical protein